MNAVINPKFKDFQVADISQADWGRREIATGVSRCGCGRACGARARGAA